MKTIKKETPFVSIIIPVFNDAAGIADTLQSLSQQDYKRESFEVIVVDNNSSDNTANVARSFQADFFSLKVLFEPNQGSYVSRNKGISVATGDILVFIDADMTVKSDYIRKGVAVVVDKQVDYLGCRVDIYTLSIKPGIWEIFNIQTGFPVEEYMEKHGFAGAGNIFVKKEVFDKINGFDPRFISTGDLEFGNRVRDAGFKMHYCDDIVMKHPARSSRKALFNKAVRVAKGHADLSVYYPERYGEMKLIPVLSGFVPIFNLNTGFKKLTIMERIQMILIANYIKYVSTGVRILRYFKNKII